MRIEADQVKRAVQTNKMILVARHFYVNKDGVEGGCALCHLALSKHPELKEKLKENKYPTEQRDIVLKAIEADMGDEYNKDYAYGFINGFDLNESCTRDPYWHAGWKDGRKVREALMSFTVGVKL